MTTIKIIKNIKRVDNCSTTPHQPNFLGLSEVSKDPVDKPRGVGTETNSLQNLRPYHYLFGIILLLLQSCYEPKESYQTTSYVESQLFYITSPIGGKLKKLYVHEGQKLDKDEKVLTIEGQEAIKTPDDSTVVDIYYQHNEFVPPNMPIISLELPSQKKVIFYVPENHLNRLKLGKKIALFLNDKKYYVKITFIAHEAEYTPDAFFNEKNRNKLVYRVKANITDSKLQELLKVGQPVEVNYE